MSRASSRIKRLETVRGVIRKNCQCKYYDNQVILVLIASSFITTLLSPVEQVIADSESIKLVDNDETNLDKNLVNSTRITAANDTKSPKNQTTAPTVTKNNTNSDGFERGQTLDLIADADSSHRFWTIANQSDRHVYNVGYEKDNNPTTKLVASKGLRTNSNGSIDDLSVADSRFIPKSASSRFDEDVDVVEDYANSSDESYDVPSSILANSYDGSSSNLNEQKVVKELTKILGKGMSSAADQVGLDTLENWKRRQRKRKAVKDNRAKLFEDLLNAAIVSHPEKSKKKSNRKRSGGKSDSSTKQSSYAPSTGLSGNANIDPDMAFDAENVINHLQGLSTLLDGQPSLGNLGFNSGGDDSSQVQDETVSGSNEEPNESTAGGHQLESLPSSASPDETGETSKPTKANDRPLVRQFKKIKKQISQRRKQLDQIKKIFNIDLALNPKDGSLMGKSATSSSSVNSKRPQGSFSGVSSSDDEESVGPPTPKKRNSNTNAKMRDLMQYLKKNPEILASVMSELTVDSDPTSQKLGSGNDDPGSHYQSLNMGSFDSASGPGRVHNTGGMDGTDGTDRIIRKHEKLSNSRSVNSQGPEQFLTNSRQHSRTNLSDNMNSLMVKPLAGIIGKAKSAEALLLASLRERQLMNLARLEMVLAEHQSASDRSQVFSSLLRQPGITKREDDGTQSKSAASDTVASTTAAPVEQSRNHQASNNSSASDREKSVAPKGEVHHFVVTNLDDHPIDARLIRQANETMATRHYQYPSSGNPAGHPYDSPAVANKQPFNQNHISVVSQMHNNHHTQQQPFLPHQFSGNLGLRSSPHHLMQPTHHQYNHQHSHLQNYHQQQLNPLNRFRDWRDVSQSETGLSQRSDGIGPGNITWLPYDLTTGSTSNTAEADRSPSSHYASSYRAQSSDRRTQSVPNDHKASQGRNKGTVDSSITRPGGHSRHMSYQEQSNDPAASGELENGRSSLSDRDFASATEATSSRAYSEPVEDSEQADSIDSADHQPETSIGRQTTHVDYFSAYKRDWEDNGSKRKRRNNLSNLIDGNSDRNDNNNYPDHDGAIWA